MGTGFTLRIAIGLAVALPVLAEAPPAPPQGPPRAALPARYESPFAGYKASRDEPVASWKEVNDLVHRLGGWSAFARGTVPDLREVPAPASDSAKEKPAPKPPSSPGHPAHGKH